MFGCQTWKNWADICDDELRVFSTLDLKKIRLFVRKHHIFFPNIPTDDFRLMRMVCLSLVSQYPYLADIHVLILAAIWLSSNGCWVPHEK